MQIILLQHTREVFVELHLDRLLLVVLITFLRLSVETLFAIEQVGGLIPGVTKGIDIEGVLLVTSLHHNRAAVLYGITDLGIADSKVLHELLELKLMLVADLDNHTRILCKQNLHNVKSSLSFWRGLGRGSKVVQVNMHTSLGVGKAHL